MVAVTSGGARVPRRGSLIAVGTGIKVADQTTPEALSAMREAEKLFYLVADDIGDAWVRKLNPTAESLKDAYAVGRTRRASYREMTERILAPVRGGQAVCAAFYGHPGVFVGPSHDAIRRARREGFRARMLPGISAEDCLFADLGVNPASAGCQSFEATDFLAARRRFDPSSALILWQVGVLGEPSVRTGMTCRPERLAILAARLRRFYPPRHPLVLYEASPFAICDPAITRTTLAKLPQMPVEPMVTLYVPPRPSRLRDPRVKRWMMDPAT
jgi:hypothetical protein